MFTLFIHYPLVEEVGDDAFHGMIKVGIVLDLMEH